MNVNWRGEGNCVGGGAAVEFSARFCPRLAYKWPNNDNVYN